MSSTIPSKPTEASAVIRAAIARAGQLATLPEIALEVMRLADDPTATGDDLDRVLSQDPALSARVLKIVNSAYYGVRREVTSIGTAIVVLGFSAVKNIAVAASLARMFRVANATTGFEPRELWHHSVAVATAARLIALRQRGIDPSDAFLAGLMHDIGLIVELQACHEPFLATVALAALEPSRGFRVIEEEVIGASHEAFGAALCEAWRFPESLRRVCGHHHQPMLLPDHQRRLTAIVHVADVLAARCALGYARTVDADAPDGDVLAWLGVTDDMLTEMQTALPALVADVMPTLSGGA